MDVMQSNEDFLANAYNNLEQNEIESIDQGAVILNDNDNVNAKKYDNGFNEEHIRKMKQKKQAKREKKQLKAKQQQELLLKGVSSKNKTTFLGQHKWLGGAVDPQTGKIYGIPAHSYQIICITPPSSTSKDHQKLGKISTIPLPNEFQEGKYKWLRGLVYDGYLYGIPAWSVKGILKVKLHPNAESTTNDVKVLPLPHDPDYYRPKKSYCEQKKIDQSAYENQSNEHGRNRKFINVDRGRWMWHGGAVGGAAEKISDDPDSDAAIYCIPSNAQHVLKVHLDGSDKLEEIGPSLSEGQNKW